MKRYKANFVEKKKELWYNIITKNVRHGRNGVVGLFAKPEVVILKESSDAKAYLEKLEMLYDNVKNDTNLAEKIEKEIAITKAGIIGEEQIFFELKNSGMDLVVLHDVYIADPAGNGAQIDFLVITPYVNVLIECKNLFGNIEINNKGDFIRTIEYGKKRYKEGLYSPITQNERHMRVFKECRKATKGLISGALMEMGFDNFNKSLIVLANPKTVVNDRYAPKDVKKQVIRADQLIATLREMRSDVKSSKKEMLALGEKILTYNIEERKDYFAKFEELQKDAEAKSVDDESVEGNQIEETKENADDAEMAEEKPQVKNDAMNEAENSSKKVCPRCGRELVLRTAKKGNNQGNQFWGCSGFPKCRYIESIESEASE